MVSNGNAREEITPYIIASAAPVEFPVSSARESIATNAAISQMVIVTRRPNRSYKNPVKNLKQVRAMEILQNVLHFNREDMIAFGDDVNDITMFQHCKTSICMGNGNDQTKSYASFVTDDIKDGLQWNQEVKIEGIH